MAIRNPKEIKLQPKHRALTYGSKKVPWLSVSGVWLEELGFKARWLGYVGNDSPTGSRLLRN